MNLARRVANLEIFGPRRSPSTAVPLDQPADVLAVLAEAVNDVRADPFADPQERARTLGFLASVALRVMEGRDVAERLEAVERVLKLRRDQQRDRERQRR